MRPHHRLRFADACAVAVLIACTAVVIALIHRH